MLISKNLSLLLVDDDLLVLRALAPMLGRTYAVTMAFSDDDACRLLETRAFDVVLTDYNIRGVATGLRVLRCARARSVPCVLHTGEQIFDAEAHRLASAVLPKPSPLRRILGALDGALAATSRVEL